MDLEYTLQRFALQLKNKSRTLRRVARVFHLSFLFSFDLLLIMSAELT